METTSTTTGTPPESINFDTLMDEIIKSDDAHPFVITPDWGQGKTIFGGLSVAMLATALRKTVAPEWQLLSLNTTFVKAFLSNTPCHIETEVIKAGKTVTYVEGKLIQSQQIITTVTACFGLERSSSLKIEPPHAPNLPAPEEGKALPWIPNVLPTFTQHFDFRWVVGEFPFSGSSSQEMGGWMRFRKAPSHFTTSHLVALIDAWPPATLPMINNPAPASTLTWTVHFNHHQPNNPHD